jgi:glutamate-1-semialdehyde 2,1-aminomutase
VTRAAERSLAIFPGGSLGEYNLPADLALVLARGEGATVWDSEGRAFTDFTMGWGSVLLGHAHPAIVEAVKSQAGRGSNFAYVTEPALALAEEIIRAVACAERVRFCASGTEATSYAVRLARAYTGLPQDREVRGGVSRRQRRGHGEPLPQRRLPGFPSAKADVGPISGRGGGRRARGALHTISAPPPPSSRRTGMSWPASSSSRSIAVRRPIPDSSRGCARRRGELGLVLIFDETVTGFRLAYGGAQEVLRRPS